MLAENSSVLIADDDEYFRLALAALLRGPLGVRDVHETASLDEALLRLAEAPVAIALALFDLSMPGMAGPGTLSAVRECHPEVRVVVVSASQKRQDVLDSLAIGVHGYIPKGLGPIELVRALKIIFAGDIFVPAFLAELPAAASVDPLAVDPSETSRLLDPVSRHGGLNNSKPAPSMSPRQREVLALLVKGYSNKQIAHQLSLGEGTVKIHVGALLRNLGVANRAGAAAAGAMLLRD